jgi:hypothetical protein
MNLRKILLRSFLNKIFTFCGVRDVVVDSAWTTKKFLLSDRQIKK